MAAGISLRTFASRLAVGAQRLSEYETGRRTMPEELHSRAQALLDDILAGREAPGAPCEKDPASARHPLTSIRLAYGWTLRELARRHAAIVGGAADRHKIWRWENWGVIPDRPSQFALAHLLGVPEPAMLARPWPTWLPGVEGVDVDSPWDLRGVLTALEATSEAAMDRRGFLTLSSAAVASIAQRWSSSVDALVPDPLPDGVEAGSADDVVASFENRLPVVRVQEHLHGGAVVLGAISSELATARQMLDWNLGREAHRRLLSATAELSRLGGWAAFDAGQPAAAETYFVSGLRAAREAREPSAAANIIKSMSLLLLESDRPKDAQRLLAAGRQAAAYGPPRIQAMVASRQARTEAVLGNSDATFLRLGEANQLLARAVGRDDHPPQTSYFDPGELAAQTAVSHQILGRHSTTVGLLETALHKQPDSRPRDRATYQLWMCRSALAMGELDRVASMVGNDGTGLSASAVMSSARNQALLRGVREQLTHRRNDPAVRKLDERLRDLIT